MKFLSLLIVSTLAACGSSTVATQNEELVYENGDRVCLTTGGSVQTITLLEDVKLDQMTVKAELKSGKVTMVDVIYLSDQINCGKD
jgi:hypothetical protein